MRDVRVLRVVVGGDVDGREDLAAVVVTGGEVTAGGPAAVDDGGTATTGLGAAGSTATTGATGASLVRTI